jgi:hypothetical protein
MHGPYRMTRVQDPERPCQWCEGVIMITFSTFDVQQTAVWNEHVRSTFSQIKLEQNKWWSRRTQDVADFKAKPE